jgi:UDP-MurNAc hydroxylase
MQAISLGHAGILIRTRGVTIVCDPWFVPAFFGSWFVFPRNDQLPDDIMHDVCNPDFLYISHLHGDHFDAAFLAEKMNKNTTVLLPDYPTRELEREFNKLGFRKFERTINATEREIAPGLKIAIHVETSITDGPGGDSAIVVSDGDARLVNQNDCRTNDLDELVQHGKVDLHWLQFSGAIWYPMVYEMNEAEKLRLCRDKVESQFSRALRYVESVKATTVVPSAGPPCFLDEDLFHLNMVTGDEASIFPDQTEFQKRMSDIGRLNAATTIPGTSFMVIGGGVTVEQPMSGEDITRIFTEKTAYLQQYQADWAQWLADEKASWASPDTDIIATLKLWWEPLLAMSPSVRQGVGGNALIVAGDVNIYINFFDGIVEEHAGQTFAYKFTVPRNLLERVVSTRAVDWSNSLFLSCRFTAWRDGAYNEYLYNFLKSLSVERMNRTESEAKQKLQGIPSDESDITIGDYIVQRRCPHRNADLSVFGEIEDDSLVCTLHGWKFDLDTGECRNAAEKAIRVRKRDA